MTYSNHQKNKHKGLNTAPKKCVVPLVAVWNASFDWWMSLQSADNKEKG